ncbi:serine hydrolase [Phenylobacterium sp.]|uniref:serine hydrolase domain-containing protein n=1 Tax=Phenylobacterium sp. TaxID=1871053 RepID=UPI0027315E63|nr:serine hydrolase domain-containing protein [Phenylobacterium sp.]MDP1618386.1 serine hydrolase domain-containing protein [Phenylobacterium sp.]MDP1986490.1 serine hydrolase domain-containing protein [Phenylobacterium sp.]
MRLHLARRLAGAASALALAALATGPVLAADVPMAAPAEAGFSATGVEALKAEMQALVDQKKLAGAVTLLAREGKVVHFEAYGVQDVATGQATDRDTIYRIASMTKPITGVAMMILWEEGKWSLDDPVAKYIPEFADLKVATPDGGTEPQAHPMTMRELMSHTAGFDVSAGYDDDGLQDDDLQAMIDKLAALPLAVQPGTDWRYGPSVNIQGYIVEKLSGQTLDAFFKSRIFDPLKMDDTGFHVDSAKLARVSAVHTYGDDGLIAPAGEVRAAPTSPPAFLSGSGGLFSTAEDYWRFAQMLANGGELDGARILKPETVELMRTNVLAEGVTVDLYGPSQTGTGFGLDFAVINDPQAAGTPQGLNSFYWGGAFGTWFWIDPTNDLVFVGMIQNLRGSIPGAGTPPMRDISPRLVYEALTTD